MLLHISKTISHTAAPEGGIDSEGRSLSPAQYSLILSTIIAHKEYLPTAKRAIDECFNNFDILQDIAQLLAIGFSRKELLSLRKRLLQIKWNIKELDYEVNINQQETP